MVLGGLLVGMGRRTAAAGGLPVSVVSASTSRQAPYEEPTSAWWAADYAGGRKRPVRLSGFHRIRTAWLWTNLAGVLITGFACGSARGDVALLGAGGVQQPSWPLLIDSFPRLDTTRLVQLSSGRLLYRANITLRFKDNISESAKAAFFSRHNMTVVGVTRSGQFFVGIPDPGPSLDSLFSVLEQLNQEPEVLVAASLNFSPLQPVRD